MNEKQLVSKAKTGDKESFCQLYGLYKDRLYRYAYYRLGNTADAEDAVSDTIVSAYEQISSLKKSGAFCSWIFKILYANCSKYIKLQIQLKEAVNIEDLENSVCFSQSMSNENSELKQALDILSNEEKELVLLSVAAGLNSSEIAGLTGLKAGSVRSKLSRSLAKMRGFLGDSYE